MPHLSAFITWWLDHRPNSDASAKLTKFEQRLLMALRNFGAAYETPIWQYAVLESVSAIDYLLDIEQTYKDNRDKKKAKQTEKKEGKNPSRGDLFFKGLGNLLSLWNTNNKAGVSGSLAKHLYEIRCKIAHGDWITAQELAIKLAKELSPSSTLEEAPLLAAQYARRALRISLLVLSYLDADTIDDLIRSLTTTTTEDPGWQILVDGLRDKLACLHDLVAAEEPANTP